MHTYICSKVTRRSSGSILSKFFLFCWFIILYLCMIIMQKDRQTGIWKWQRSALRSVLRYVLEKALFDRRAKSSPKRERRRRRREEEKREVERRKRGGGGEGGSLRNAPRGNYFRVTTENLEIYYTIVYEYDFKLKLCILVSNSTGFFYSRKKSR